MRIAPRAPLKAYTRHHTVLPRAYGWRGTRVNGPITITLRTYEQSEVCKENGVYLPSYSIALRP